MIEVGDLVTIAPPFGDGVTQWPVSGKPHQDTCTLWQHGEHVAYRDGLLTVVGTTEDFELFTHAVWKITKRAFWNRFPDANETAMRAVIAQGSPALLAGHLLRLQVRVESSPFVDLELAETIAGIGLLASDAVPETVTIDGVTLPFRLTAEQADTILRSPPREDEVFK